MSGDQAGGRGVMCDLQGATLKTKKQKNKNMSVSVLIGLPVS